jgi:GR25 family glycosyltransferase involved in LPS biosynthesis
MPWDFLDAVFCITLDTATARHAAVQTELRKVGLWDKTVLLKTKRDPESGVRGCYVSHKHAWDAVRARGLQNVLIVEDDVFFADDWRTGERDAADFVRRCADWDCLFLGWTPRRSKRTQFKHVDRIVCGAATHAYIVNQRAVSKPLPPYETAKLPVDILLMCPQAPERYKRLSPFAPLTDGLDTAHTHALYALKPMIAFQRFDGTSATNNLRINVDGRLKQSVRLMRLYGSTASTTNITAATIWFVLLIVVLVAIVIAVPLAVCKK